MDEPSLPEWPPQRRVVRPEDAEQRLLAFGMTLDVISKSIEVGDTARRRVMQPVYPKTFAGVTMWAETLSEWRRQMLKRRVNYEIGRTRGYETLYSVEREAAFTVVAGDSFTGIDGSRDPKLKRAKGVITSQRVALNKQKSTFLGVQLALIPTPDKNLPPDEACDTWFLIVRPTKTEIRLELSRPVRIDGDNIVSGYDERILLPPVQISGAIEPITPDDLEDDSDGGDDLVGH
jgi:hypothetical protein